MIPIMKPYVAPIDPKYLERIGSSRWYTNAGPLLKEYEGRISEYLEHEVVATASCTSGMIAVLLASGMPRGSKVAYPDWTFRATPCAIAAAGYIPIPFPCDNTGVPIGVTDDCAGVVAVSRFGAPVNLKTLSGYAHHYVMIDGAACFGGVRDWYDGSVPLVISTHATKVFSTGEGGLVLGGDAAWRERIRCLINFGIDANRNVMGMGINGKMSEYHAAVGLSELDNWEVKRGRWESGRNRYVGALEIAGFDVPEWFKAPNLPHVMGVRVQNRLVRDGYIEELARAGITSRAIWHDGGMTDDAARVVFIPYWMDMTDRDIAGVVGVLREARNKITR